MKNFTVKVLLDGVIVTTFKNINAASPEAAISRAKQRFSIKNSTHEFVPIEIVRK